MPNVKQKFLKRRKRLITYTMKDELSSLRVSVFRSNKHIYAQLINDQLGHTLVSASTLSALKTCDLIAKTNTILAATKVGEHLALNAQKLNITSAYFDRGRYKYHGRVKGVSDGAKNFGLSN